LAAFSLSSEKNHTRATLKSLFLFLSDFKNFVEILPSDRVTDFKYSENECSFSIKGITPMTVKLSEKRPYEQIVFTSEGLGKFNFVLRALFVGDADKDGECRVELSGDLNAFIKSMAEKPLTDLINTMSSKLSQLQVQS